ncbi:hypothetical protein ACLB1E_11840 [Escherichia coli]
MPEDYRIYGPEIVALSFFAVAPEHNDGEYHDIEELSDVFENFESGIPPEDPDLYVFWLAEKQRHPRLFRMEEYIRLFLCGDFTHPSRVQRPIL